MKGAGNPSPVWEKGRDEGLPYPQKAQRPCIASIISGGPSPLPLSHPGEGFPAPYAPISSRSISSSSQRSSASAISRVTSSSRAVALAKSFGSRV